MKKVASLWPTSWHLQGETIDFEKTTTIHTLESTIGSVINLNKNDSCHTSIQSGRNSDNDRYTQVLMKSSKQQAVLNAKTENKTILGRVSPDNRDIGFQSVCDQKSILLQTSCENRSSCRKATFNTKTTTDGIETTVEQRNQLAAAKKPLISAPSDFHQGVGEIKVKQFRPIYSLKSKSVLRCKQVKKSNFRKRSLRHSLCIEWKKNQRSKKQSLDSSFRSALSSTYPTSLSLTANPSTSSSSSSSFLLSSDNVKMDSKNSYHLRSQKLDFEGLKQLVPSLRNKEGTNRVNNVQIMKEAVDYIKELQRKIQQRFTSSRALSTLTRQGLLLHRSSSSTTKKWQMISYPRDFNFTVITVRTIAKGDHCSK